MKPRRSTIGESQSKAAHLNFTIHPTTTQSWKDFWIFTRPDSRVVNSWFLSLFLNHQIFVSCQRDYQCLAQHDISFCWKQHFYHPTVLQFTSPEECYIISVYKFVFIYIFVFVFVCSEQSTIVNLCQRIAASTSLQNMNETREGMTHISNTFMSNSYNIINSVNNIRGFKVLSLLTPNSLHEHDLNPTISSVLM